MEYKFQPCLSLFIILICYDLGALLYFVIQYSFTPKAQYFLRFHPPILVFDGFKFHV